MKRFSNLLWCGLLLSLLSGARCVTLSEYPRYDKVLVYERPYDYTYLKTLEALNTMDGWVLEETDKEAGLIVLRNLQYGHLFDRDKWRAQFLVKRLSRKATSVELVGESQRLEKGGELLERIDAVMKASIAARDAARDIAV